MTTPLIETIARAKLSHHVDCFETAAANHERYRACRMVSDKMMAEMPEWVEWPKWRAILFGLFHPTTFFRTVGRIEAMGEVILSLRNDEHRAMITASLDSENGE